MTITKVDPFAVNNQKLELAQEIINVLLEELPNHTTCAALLHSGQYKYFQGEPSQTLDVNRLTELHFGILEPTPVDNRNKIIKRLFPLDTPRPSVIGSMVIKFEIGSPEIKTVHIFIFGYNKKDALEKYSERISDYSGYVETRTNRPLEQHEPITLFY